MDTCASVFIRGLKKKETQIYPIHMCGEMSDINNDYRKFHIQFVYLMPVCCVNAKSRLISRSQRLSASAAKARAHTNTPM